MSMSEKSNHLWSQIIDLVPNREEVEVNEPLNFIFRLSAQIDVDAYMQEHE
jgi:hypothetical protein